MSKVFTKVTVHTVNDLTDHYWLSEIIWQVPRRCHRRLPNLNIPYFEWHWMHVQFRHISASNLSFGAAPPRFQPSLATWRDSLSSLPPTFPFTVCKPWPSARGMVLVALTAEYQECLKGGPVFLYQSKTLQEQHVGYHAQHFAPFKVASFHIASKRANGSYAQTNQNQNDVGLQVHTEIIKRSSFAVCLAEQQRGM